MIEKKPSRVELLRAMLAVLIDEWSLDTVRSELNRISTETREPLHSGELTAGEPGSETRRKRPSEKPTAAMMAAKVSLPPGQKQLVQMLAVKFDSKQFLPTSGDIRYFFEAHGEDAPPSKQRIESFRRVLRLLSSLPEGALRTMIDDAVHSGPSSLGPLSDAMRGVGAQRSSMFEQSQPLTKESEPLKERPDPGVVSPDT